MEDSTNEFDLMYLTNVSNFKKVNNNILEPELYEDIKFYKKRIMKQIEDLMDGKSIESQLDNSLKRYLFLSIQHFKFIDKRDIIQKEYDCIKIKKPPQRDFNLKKMNKMFEKTNENLCKITDVLDIKIKYKKEVILPRKKVINLRNEKLKTKGLEKKECHVNISVNAKKGDTSFEKKIKTENKTEKKNKKKEKKGEKIIDGKMFSKG
jgi:hypothetical protein